MLEQSFCASPWLHMRIDPQGNFRACRWKNGNEFDVGNIRDDSAIDFFQKTLAPLRTKLLDGHRPSICTDCYHMEQHHKVSGRQRQLLKVGIATSNFQKTLKTSTFFDSFLYSHNHNGHTQTYPLDWQIDLGNYCNSACLFCKPESSSRLAAEYKILKLIDKLPEPNWSDDASLIDKFCKILTDSPQLAYLHFIGGETLITSGFRTILEKLIAHGHSRVHVGFTTNLTVWSQDVIDLLMEFENLHVGLSIECLHPLNDYMRWPSKIQQVTSILDRWVALAKHRRWLVQLRPTPNCFTVKYISGLYQYAIDHGIGVETCNFIEDPKQMRINALPPDLMEEAKKDIRDFLMRNCFDQDRYQVINTRKPSTIQQQVLQDASSYLNYLQNESHDPELSRSLIDFLKLFENRRANSILDYSPEYEPFLRHFGY
jgi:hypothetical protein